MGGGKVGSVLNADILVRVGGMRVTKGGVHWEGVTIGGVHCGAVTTGGMGSILMVVVVCWINL